ncbi:hypothetical protein QNH46_09795 [Paenibacillus woosongensis]|uniref:Uncharacterized protein n=1 Tax=Paenibacillus woosongensis TaxID=307580 RepID=A0AA95L252_9BACL|nr:hypothetical protein [Paenibacillus woosongensis]WHX50904.1 hypothetical protein QNH46_09795 [Paenibacillus woosongensis]
MQTEYLFMAIAFIVAALVPYFFKRRLRKKTGLPETDERVLHQFQKFTLFIVCIISIIGVLALGIYTLLGHDTLQHLVVSVTAYTLTKRRCVFIKTLRREGSPLFQQFNRTSPLQNYNPK